jgi:hypothetical protein
MFGLPMNFQAVILVIVVCILCMGWIIQGLLALWYLVLMFVNSFTVYPQWKEQRRQGNDLANVWIMLQNEIERNRS